MIASAHIPAPHRFNKRGVFAAALVFFLGQLLDVSFPGGPLAPRASLAQELRREATDPAPGAAAEKASFERDVQPFLEEFCYQCHGLGAHKGDLALDKYKTNEDVLRDRRRWEEGVAAMLAKGEMPPREADERPTPDQVDAALKSIRGVLDSLDCDAGVNVGRVTLRRLNRLEYNNTIRDLLGVDFKPAEDFPLDDVGYGFDNIGDVLSTSPLLLEKYLQAAEGVLDKLLDGGSRRINGSTAISDAQQRLLEHDEGLSDREAARQIVARLASRAYRRPATPEEVEMCLASYDAAQAEGEPFVECVRLAVMRVLVSPNFLFRVEIDPPGLAAGDNYAINEYELASRLSYFLWSSMPDEQLFALAAEGKLRENLESEVRRMLADEKSSSFISSFAGQWLTLRKLDEVSPDPKLFPQFDNELRQAMWRETELFFDDVVREDLSIFTFIDADFTFVNGPLARFYGIPNVRGERFRKVAVPAERGGVLTQASILTLTSHATRTSPVLRGKFILEQILDTPPPPPPANVPPLAEDKALAGSLREVMEKHRENPLCASCHARMDPLGFAFENFDAVGHWRDQENERAIDASGVLPDGQEFQGASDLKTILLAKKDLFARCLSGKMLTYAIGRGLEYYDQCAVDAMVTALAENDYRFSTLILEVTKSDPFQRRTAIGASP